MGSEGTIAVVLAAGIGSRILPLSHEIPKCMLEVQDQPMLHRALSTLQELQVSKSIVIGGHRSEKLILPEGAKLVLNDRFQHNNILHSLAYARPEIDGEDQVLVTYSDIVFRKSVAAQLLAEDQKDMVIVVDQAWKERYIGRTLHPLSEAEAAQFDSNGRLLRSGKDLLTDQYDPQQWGEFIGMLKLSRAGYKHFWYLFDEINAKLDPEAPFQQSSAWRTAYLTDFLQELVDRGTEINCTLIQGGWLEIDTLQDYETAQTFDFS